MNGEHLNLLLSAKSLLGKGNDMGVIDMLAVAVGLPYCKPDLARLLGAPQTLINYYDGQEDDGL